MSELLKALESSFLGRVHKEHKVCIGGKITTVDLETKKEILKHGEGAYHWVSDTEFRLKPPPKPKTQFSELVVCRKGYSFHDGDIHWPKETVDNGETWLTEQE